MASTSHISGGWMGEFFSFFPRVRVLLDSFQVALVDSLTLDDDIGEHFDGVCGRKYGYI